MRYLFFQLFLYVTINAHAQAYTQTMRRLPDTGQNSSYTGTFGEDNDYNINTPLFKSVTNGTVIDSITGLMWQVTDGGEMSYSTALIYCSTLTLGGYSDWRLPNAHEAFSVLNYQNTNPPLDVSVFTAGAAEYWWTSDRQVNDSAFVWVTNSGGGLGNHRKVETISAGGTRRFHARAVRSVYSSTVLPSRFTNNTLLTALDNVTGLMWQKSIMKDTLSWEDALRYADSAMTGGYSDWRLPNIKEMQSINDAKLIGPSINSNYFNNSGVKKYWSSTTLPNQTLKAWYVDTQYGIVTNQLKTSKLNVLLVRGDGKTVTGLADNLKAEKLEVYPNPFTQFIILKNENADVAYELINSIGQVVYSGKLISSTDFSYLNTGIYLLKVVGNSSSFLKLIKE